MNFINSLFKNNRVYDEDKLNYVLSRHNDDTNLIFFPFIKDGYVLNNVIKYMSINDKQIKRFILFDNNIFLLYVYCSVYMYHEEFISALQLIEKVYNSSDKKKEIYDLVIAYLNCRQKFNEAISYGNKFPKNKILQVAHADLYLRNHSSLDTKTNAIDQKVIDMQSGRRDTVNLAIIAPKEQKSFNIIGGYDVAKEVKKYNKFDKTFIEAISAYNIVTTAALYFFLQYTSKTILIDEYEYKRYKFVDNIDDSVKSLDFSTIYDLINELHQYMKQYTVEMYCWDFGNGYEFTPSYRIVNDSVEFVPETFFNFYDSKGNYNYFINLRKDLIIPNKKYLIQY